ncbi:MAG: A/G-specific adenine glycosylase [Elusimicrobia bacterium]|nr:A/G-specific adenine glycosylase [Elusimicrobiota bacterium]
MNRVPPAKRSHRLSQKGFTPPIPALGLLRKFQSRLLQWYDRYRRDLPWRETTDPYAILVSEIMLQQTQVDRVIPKYHEFLQRYPTVRHLAKAPLRQLKKVWYPLGYNDRPVRLREIAREVVTRYDGKIPNTAEGLLAMDGVGRYTAGAVLSFAYRQDAPILDTNVSRVLRRVFGVDGDPKRSPAQKHLWHLAKVVIPKGKGYLFNQALMDFGALVCTARKPLCLLCPMNTFCKAYPVN